MVDFHDRRKDDRDFVGGTGNFHLARHGQGEEDRWAKQPLTRASRREVGGYYRNQNPGRTDPQTWREANRLASRRTRRSGDGATAETTNNYAIAFHQNLINVLSQKGPHLARKYGEIPPGR